MTPDESYALTNVALDVWYLHTQLGPQPLKLNAWTDEAFEWRKRRLNEEFAELMEALDSRDPVKILHESIDVIFVVLGTLLHLGFKSKNIGRAWYKIVKANQAKQKDPNGEKWIKPEGWQPADLYEEVYA